MKRPNHDLSWRAIRRQWSTPVKKSNTINGSIGNHHLERHPSDALLGNEFELLTNNNVNAEKHSIETETSKEKKRSETLLDFAVPSLSKIKRSDHRHNLSKELHSCDIEPIRSELRSIISHLSVLTNHARQAEKQDNESQDWKFVAMVVDRLCLVLFTVSMALFTGLTYFYT